MCQYIKDNGEQCGRDADPFCHDHEDTPQAKQWHRMDVLFERIDALENELERIVEEAESGLSDGLEPHVIDAKCEVCETSLRRSARVTEHPNQPHRVVFEELVECDCTTHVLDARSTLTANLPEHWV